MLETSDDVKQQHQRAIEKKLSIELNTIYRTHTSIGKTFSDRIYWLRAEANEKAEKRKYKRKLLALRKSQFRLSMKALIE